MDENGKQCSKCERVLPHDDFHKSGRGDDGLQRWCKECYQEYYLAHREGGNVDDIEPTQRLSFWQDEPFELTARHKMLLLISDIELDLLKLRRLLNEEATR